ncbi:MAG: hypothetical protein AUH95_04185 [Nitrospirae bacterium 13_2_20CM_2_63_8]|nr:MAG: hypothetical protein AUH95_04185 [Nitrospirae bacterium 13_2_20CM_2_63_8]
MDSLFVIRYSGFRRKYLHSFCVSYITIHDRNGTADLGSHLLELLRINDSLIPGDGKVVQQFIERAPSVSRKLDALTVMKPSIPFRQIGSDGS